MSSGHVGRFRGDLIITDGFGQHPPIPSSIRESIENDHQIAEEMEQLQVDNEDPTPSHYEQGIAETMAIEDAHLVAAAALSAPSDPTQFNTLTPKSFNAFCDEIKAGWEPK
jgi:hypothetical protein